MRVRAENTGAQLPGTGVLGGSPGGKGQVEPLTGRVPLGRGRPGSPPLPPSD